MNIVILLLGLLSPYMDASPQKPIPDLVFASQPSIALSFQHSSAPDPYIGRFDSLAGVSLYDTKEELLQAKGMPLDIARDPWQECLEYQYEDMSAGVCDGVVLYVHVAPDQAWQYGLSLNGVDLNPEKDSLRGMLGTPYFIAEDGDVYMRGNTALKIYRNSVTGEWEGIDLFDGNSS